MSENDEILTVSTVKEEVEVVFIGCGWCCALTGLFGFCRIFGADLSRQFQELSSLLMVDFYVEKKNLIKLSKL